MFEMHTSWASGLINFVVLVQGSFAPQVRQARTHSTREGASDISAILPPLFKEDLVNDRTFSSKKELAPHPAPNTLVPLSADEAAPGKVKVSSRPQRGNNKINAWDRHRPDHYRRQL